ncbi:hypothetical protein MJH54_31830, partial [Salmonella enterica subsp. enterica serovar Montevideo]|nr:hypothetical protein [Salmonella enterica subsp. enterica serovar Montevideo]
QLNIKTCQCRHYERRFEFEPDCIKLTRENLPDFEWLPMTCAYLGEPLIFGVTLPLGKPFIGACLGGAVGGALISYWKVATVITFG